MTISTCQEAAAVSIRLDKSGVVVCVVGVAAAAPSS